jgi:energy-coupling factor transport system ATP-binding protein
MLFCSSVEEEIGFGPKMMGYPPDEIKRRVEESLERLGLAPLRDRHPFILSLGDRQRVAVACVLALEPKVFVFDEPTTGQDFFGGESIMGTIDKLHEEGYTVVMITHDMQLVAKHARRVIVMSVGQVALDTTPAQAFAQIDLLESLALRPPQVTRLAHLLGRRGEAILGVAELCDWLAANYPPQQSAENAPS